MYTTNAGGAAANILDNRDVITSQGDEKPSVISRVRADAIKYNCRVKYRPDPQTRQPIPYEIMVFDRNVFRERGWEPIDDKGYNIGSDDDDKEIDAALEKVATVERGTSRARAKIRDYIVCNPDMTLFVTLTIDQEKLDRYDYNKIITKLNRWLDNRVRRKGLKYILIPEYHKDRAIHFHGFMNEALELKRSGKYKRSKVTDANGNIKTVTKPIYNLPDWEYGFTTAVAITGSDSIRRTSEYVLKYITKETGKVGGRYYLHGGKLETYRQKLYRVNIDEIKLPKLIIGETENKLTLKITRNEETISVLLQQIEEKWNIEKPIY